jgi:uncharacterized surface protein with fasciclin (FAS1) repeats
MKRLLITTAFLALTAGAAMAQAPAAPAASPAAPAPAVSAPALVITAHGDIADTLKASDQFTILVKALDANGVTPVLKSAGPLTMLAPTDAAFKALPAGQVDNLMKPENAGQLRALLVNHLINTAVPPDKLAGSTVKVPTVGGGEVLFDARGAVMKVNDANVLGAVTVSNGVIFALDKVILPPPAAAPVAPAAPAP